MITCVVHSAVPPCTHSSCFYVLLHHHHHHFILSWYHSHIPVTRLSLASPRALVPRVRDICFHPWFTFFPKSFPEPVHYTFFNYLNTDWCPAMLSFANSLCILSSFLLGLHFFPAAAKSLQSCPTLCDPIDGSPPGSPVPGILQARTLEWVAISFSNISSIVACISHLQCYSVYFRKILVMM